MRHNILFSFILVFSFLFSPLALQTAEASGETPQERLIRQVEVLRWEVQVLQSLLANMQSRQQVTAPAYLAMNLSDHSILLERNAHSPYPIASITKLMSAVIALEHIDQTQTITLTQRMLEPYGHSPTLFLGLNVSAENLLKASLIQSTNDASEALAHSMGREAFISLMNQKAQELGMDNTVFYDAHGLNPANRSTASDLAKLVAYIHKFHPEILQTTKHNDFWLPDQKGSMLKFLNMNNFYPLSSFIGGKTGYLPQARQTLASVFRVHDEPIAIILLYSGNRQADTFSILRAINN